MKSWFVFYTYPKAEKYVQALLTDAGFEVYLPLMEVVRQWHDRRKKLQLPIFPNYIFVKIDIRKIYEVLKFPRIVQCIRFNNKPCHLREDEIELIRNIENNSTNIIVSGKLKKGEWVTLQGGPLNGMKGIIQECNQSRYIIVNLYSLAYSLKVSLKPEQAISDKKTVKNNMQSVFGE